MRIAVLSDDFVPNPGGIAVYTHCMALALSEVGHSVVVITNVDCPRDFPADNNYLIKRFYVPPPKRDFSQTAFPRFRKAFHFIRNLPKIKGPRRSVREARPDLVVLATSSRWATYALEGWSGNLVVLLHGTEIPENFSKSQPLSHRQILEHAAAFLANSQNTRAIAIRNGVVPGRVHVIAPPMGLFGDKASPSFNGDPASLCDGKPFFFTVSRLVERKGIDNAISAFSAIKQSYPSAYYLIAGIGPDEHRLKMIARERNLEESVIFLGRISDALKQQLLATCVSLVLPCRQIQDDVEGFGIVFIEAALAGAPSIAGDTGGIRDAVVDGETGILVDPYSVDAIALAMTRVWSDPMLRNRLGKNAKERAENEFGLWAFAQEFHSVIRDAAPEESPPR